jgi:guanylate kinase
MKKHFGDLARIIFIEPPSVEELERRLKGRGTEKVEVIEERVRNARFELTRKNDYDYLVMNDDFVRALEELKKIFKQEIK